MSMHRTIDKFGATLSGACALHCAMAPILITIAPLLGIGFLFDHRFESVIILMAIGFASLSVGWGFVKKHRQFLPLGLLFIGSMFLMSAYFHYMILPHPATMALGGISIAISHIINAKLCKHCESCSHEHV